MDKKLKLVYDGGIGEITTNKSRFIASVSPVNSEDAANEYIHKLKKKYWDATHNCFAYVIGNKNEIQKCSDDGEPSGTAGKPILDVILGEKIHNVVVVVTRYFGGTLLGTGGLVRAYSKAAKEGLNNSVIIEKQLGKKMEVISDYNGIGKILYLISQLDITTLESDYSETVMLTVIVLEDIIETFKDNVTQVTSGKANIIELNLIYFAKIKNEVLLFEE